MTVAGPTVTVFLFGLAMFMQFLAGLDWIQSLGHQRLTLPLSARGQAHLKGSCARLLSITMHAKTRQATRRPRQPVSPCTALRAQTLARITAGRVIRRG